jgi:hypothetical protein
LIHIEDYMLMQQKLCCVNLFNRIWITWKTIWITPTYLRCMFKIRLQTKHIYLSIGVHRLGAWSHIVTSRKHGKKELQSFVHCGSFDHPDLHLLNDYNFFFLVYQLKCQRKSIVSIVSMWVDSLYLFQNMTHCLHDMRAKTW